MSEDKFKRPYAILFNRDSDIQVSECIVTYSTVKRVAGGHFNDYSYEPLSRTGALLLLKAWAASYKRPWHAHTFENGTVCLLGGAKYMQITSPNSSGGSKVFKAEKQEQLMPELENRILRYLVGEDIF